MTLAIRTAVAADIPPMHSLRLSVRENRLTRPESITHDDYRPFVDAAGAWVAEDDGALRGFAALDVATCVVWALFVAPEAEGQGVGRALHDRMVDFAAGLGLNRLQLTTAPGTRAEHFYRARGWTVARQLPDGQVALTLAVKPAGARR